MSVDIARRDFLKTSAAAAASPPRACIPLAAPTTFNIGWIGVGTRGNAGIGWLTGVPR